MLVVCYMLVFALLTTHLSPATAGIGTAPCLDCPLEDGDSRGKLSFNPIIPADEDFLKAIALASGSSLLGGGRGGGGALLLSPQQHKAKYYHASAELQQQRNHQKILAQQQQQREVPSTSSAAAIPAPAPPSNLLHVYTLLNKGTSVQDPKHVVDEYYLQDPRAPLLASPRIAKKAERGMMVDVMDYVSKPDDRNRRVGQNMRSSG